MSSPLLSEVDLHYPDNVVDFLTTNHFPQLFNGSEIVVAGRLKDDQMDNFLVEVFGQGVRGKKEKFRDNAEVEGWFMFIFYYSLWTLFSLLCSLRMISKCRARPVLWTGMLCTQMRSTFLGISQSACGPTLPSSSYWRRGQFDYFIKAETWIALKPLKALKRF